MKSVRKLLVQLSGNPKGPLWGTRYAAQTVFGYLFVHALRDLSQVF